MKKAVLFSLSLLVIAAACSGKGSRAAKIGRNAITVQLLQERMADAPPAYQSYLATEAGRKQFLDLLVRERIVLEAARKEGYARKAEYRKSLAEFKKEQARRLRDYEENALMELYIRDLHDKELGATDKEIETYYQQHKDEFARPRATTVRHILLPTKAEAEKLLARIKAGGDFGKLAKEFSADPISAARGGEIGPFRKGDLVPEFEKAVVPLRIGEISGVVETQFGFHIIKKTAEKTLAARPADEAKFEIKKTIEKTKFDGWLDRTKKRLGVSVNYDALSKLPQPSSAQLLEPGTPEAGAAPQSR